MGVIIVFIFSNLQESEKSFDWGRCLDFDNSYKRTGEADKLWLIISTIFTVTTMLFWKVAIAEIVHEEPLKTCFNFCDPRQFVVNRYSSTERVLMKGLVNSSEVRLNQYETSEEEYNALLDKSNNMRFTISNEFRHKFILNRNPEICENLRMSDEVPTQLDITSSK